MSRKHSTFLDKSLTLNIITMDFLMCYKISVLVLKSFFSEVTDCVRTGT